MSIWSKTALAALLAGAFAAPHPADAQLLGGSAVLCTNCSTQVSSLASLAKQAQQYLQQIQQYQLQLQQYQNMLTNSISLPMSVWGQVQGDIMQVQSLSNASQLLSGNAGSMISRLQSVSSYANQVTNLGNIAGQFSNWQQTIGNSMNQFGRTLGLQQTQQQNAANVYVALEQHSQSAAGQMQAIQAGNELADANGQALIRIQQTLAATGQMIATNETVQSDRRALEDAAMQQASQQTWNGVVGQQW